nr:ribonuclease III [Chloroflexota bacterium]
MDDLRDRLTALAPLQKGLGISFRNPLLLLQALTHSSYLNENPTCSWSDNERLEFLGDAVGDFLTAEFLYERFTHWQEGELTSVRAELVRSETLARFAQQIGLGHYLLLGHGEEQSGGRTRVTVLSDAFEALLGAIYVDQGLEAARRFFLPLLQPLVETFSTVAQWRDAKSRLQEWAQAVLHETPSYRTVREEGPDHAKQFTVEVIIGGQVRGQGTGRSKQAAEQAAAQAALEMILAPPKGANSDNQ